MASRFIKKIFAQQIARRRRIAQGKAARSILSQSKLFDATWYAERYPDIAASKANPLDHFIRHGAAEGRNPSERFSTLWYIRSNPDVAASGANPLLHYLQHGRDEGRSIRSVSGAREDEDIDPATGRRSPGPPVDPYPSDFPSVWQARSVNWSLMSVHLRSDATGGMAKNAILESDDIVRPADWLAALLQTGQGETPQSARIHLFRSMRRDFCPKTGEPAADPSDQDASLAQPPHRLLATFGLGLEAIADGWFAHSAQLLVRVCNPDDRAVRLRAFQYDAAGEITCCANAAIENGELQLISVLLDNELCPILLTWESADGLLTASALLSFPSLFRGGLHHSEVSASAILSGKTETLAHRMTSLALAACCPPDPEKSFAIGRIAVALNGANGTEPILNANNVAALAAQFGVTLEPRYSEHEDALHQLGKRLPADFCGPRTAARAKADSVLVLPADGFPTLSCLTARSGDTQLGSGSFCIVDAGTRQQQALVVYPATSVDLGWLHHPALPLPYPLLEPSPPPPVNTRHVGPPIMIRFRDARVWNVDGLMPLSPDTELPALGVLPSPTEGQRPRISVIIDQSADSDDLSLCLASLARQTIAADLDLLLITDDGIPDAFADLFRERPIARSPSSGLSRAERLNRAASSASSNYLLFLDGSVCLPDLRTLAFLLEIARQPRVASASCAVMREDEADGSTMIVSAGYFEQGKAGQTIADALVKHPDFADLFPASTYKVIANDMRINLIPTPIWRDLVGLDVGASCESGFDADFGLRARAAGFDQYCTTLTRAAIARHMPDWTPADEAVPRPIPPELRAPMSDTVSRMIRLR